MRDVLDFDRGWLYHAEVPRDSEMPGNKGLKYVSAKTQTAKYGPAAYRHFDTPESWSFEDEMIPEKWESVTLPHDYMIGETPDENENAAWGFMRYHNAWYRKHFTVDPADRGKRITLLFDAISGNSTIWLNGCLITHNYCGYTPVEADISDYVFYDRENVVAVHIDSTLTENWSYQGGGIYRHVHLIKTDKICVDLYGDFIYPIPERGKWRVPVRTAVRNDTFADAQVRLVHTLVDPQGREAGSFETEGTAPLRQCTELQCEGTMDDPLLWDTDSPNQYTLVTRVFRRNAGREEAVHIVSADGEHRVDLEESRPETDADGWTACDTYSTRFGFREVRMDPEKGLFLNGRNVKIKGICAHQDFGLTGKAVPDNICRYQVQLAKRMGANGWRCSHYPQNPATMDALDETGFLVMAEVRHFASTPEALREVDMTVKRDRNRPGVIFWSTGNEELEYHTLEQGLYIQRAMRARIRKLDPWRPVSSAAGFPEKAVIYDACDLLMLNYRFAWIDALHAAHPELPVVSSENVAVSMSFGAYFGARPDDGRESAYDHPRSVENRYLGREGTWKDIMARPWLMGGYQWQGFEYRGEAVWPRLCSISGAIDLFLRPKESYYQNRSHWLREPMVYLFPHWNHRGLEGEIIDVWAYTNCDHLELFLNGESLGARDIEPYGHGAWKVPYTPGVLEVKAYRNGQPAAQDKRETTGCAAALELCLESGPVAAGRGDVALVACYALDEEGRRVPDASPVIHFDCDPTGHVIGTGADNTDHHPVPCRDRKMYMGRAAAAVLIGDEPGEVRVFARAEGLRQAVVHIPIGEKKDRPAADGFVSGGESGGHTAR